MFCRRELILCMSLAPALLSGGCVAHRVGTPEPGVTASARFHEGGNDDIDGERSGDSWWRAFGDPALDGLIQEALRENLGLRQLALRLEGAEAARRQVRAGLFPSVTGRATFESEWPGLESGNRGGRDDAASAGALLTWELDVWGRLRALVRAQEHETTAAGHDLAGARLLLSAEVAEAYFELLEQREQLRLLGEQIGVNETLLDLTRLRFGQGLSAIVDVLQQREQLASTRALVPEIEAREGELRYRLAVLLGRSPGDIQRAFGVLPEQPPLLGGAGVPSELLTRRPDLIGAAERIRALDHRVGAAIAERLPRFEIGGALTAIGDGGLSSVIGSALASVAGPLFDAGGRRAEVEIRRAQLSAALAEYSQTYLEAVRDVETALLRERKQAERVALQRDQLNTAQRLLAETRNRYSQGLTDYLPVLAAVGTEQQLERELITSRRELLSLRIALHRAAGGPMQARVDEVKGSS